jgi:NADH:ubiquinone oxidoreductase subunit
MAMSLRSLLPRANARVARTLATYIGHDGMTNYAPINVPSTGTPSVPVDTKMKFMGYEFPLFIDSNLIIQWWQGVQLYGWQRTIVQAYTMGNIKFGECVGEDVNGNRYFENRNYPYGQHRWCEFKDIHNPDVSTVPPEWHGWMTHMQDAPGASSRAFLSEKLRASKEVTGDAADSTKACTDHIGMNGSGYQMQEYLNWTSFRARGYKIGGIKQLPGEPDRFHVHPGHALNKKGTGRYAGQRYVVAGDPNSKEAPDMEPKYFRSLDKI